MCPSILLRLGTLDDPEVPSLESGEQMIALKKLDGSMMYLNEDLIERVEDGADGQSAVYMINGGHVVVANESANVVEKIRTEKASLLRRVRQASQENGAQGVAASRSQATEMTLLTKVRDL